MALFFVLCYNNENLNEALDMGRITVGREMYYMEDRINQKETISESQLIVNLANVLNSRDSFMICGRSFDLLHKLGFIEVCEYEALDSHPIQYVDIISKSIRYREQNIIDHHRTFQKIDGNIVTELYFNREDFSFEENADDYFYNLVLKGSYIKDSLAAGQITLSKLDSVRFPRMKIPSVIGYTKRGDINITCTVTRDRNIWYFENSNSYSDSIYKQYESKKVFDVSIVNYTHKKRIESVVFRLGDRQISNAELIDILPELSALNNRDKINWEHYVTQEQILVLEMNAI
jgi:hypothetical protein